MNHTIALWDFSLALYARSQVAEICLMLQDAYGININLLLWCYWLEQQDIALDHQRLVQANVQIKQWDNAVVKPLRELHRTMKAQFGTHDSSIEGVRQQIKQVELLAEKQTLCALEALVQQWKKYPLTVSSPDVNARFYLAEYSVPALVIDKTIATFATKSLTNR